ncbi:MAG: cell shape-determining protein MreC [Planctomycetota bacterium]
MTRDLGRRRTIYFVLLVLCAVLSLRPIPLIAGGIELLFVPTRLIAELVAPLAWLRSSEVRAAEERIDLEARIVRGAAEILLEVEQASALPTRLELRVGRRMIHGEVIRRSRGNLDRVEVRVASTAGIVPGLPVITGDYYVGRVAELDAQDSSMIRVDLVTARGFYVGAAAGRRDWQGELIGSEVEFVVGGLAKTSADDQLYLELHNPTLRGIKTGEVTVSEPADMDAELAKLSRGFLLGELRTVTLPKGAKLPLIQSPLDFASGLFQLIVLAPESDLPEAEVLELDTFVAENWIPVSTITRGDITATREGRRLSGGSLAGLKKGQALALGARLVGRVGETGFLTADLLSLGDVGLRLAVLAEIEGEEAPRPLGELISLGRDRKDGSLRFQWTCRIDLGKGSEGERLQADLYTGSGEDGVPRGLYIGSTELPTTREPHLLRVWQDRAVADLNHVFAWKGPETDSVSNSSLGAGQ